MPPEKQIINFYKQFLIFIKKFKKILISFAVIIILIIFYFLFLSAPKNFPINSIYDLKSGQTLSLVSDNFKELKIIKSDFWFKTFVLIFSFGDTTIIKGNYALSKKQNVLTLAWRMSYGLFDIIPIKITLPEGINSFEMADILSDNLLSFNKKNFLSLIKTKKLEGYLFPDTYFFAPNIEEEEIIKIINDNFNEKIKEVGIDIKNFNKSENDIIKMASILEEEARTIEDKKIIAGILWKRIFMNMALQVDASFKYINGKTTATLTEEDLKIDSPYNSYIKKNLPPTPISNPGLDSIKATINPEETSYLYFLTDKEGEMHYAETFEEHIRNKQKYLK
ncbi:MAG: endolytic transglycosylase MltG [bacterium]